MNVLSFHNMIKRFKSVVYNNQNTDAFLVTRDDDTIMEFRPSPEGLYYYDFNTSINRQQRGEQTMVVESVEELPRNYTETEIKRSETARRLYVVMGRPLKADFQKMLQKGKIRDNPVVMEDYNIAEKIYGKDLGIIKGKTV